MILLVLIVILGVLIFGPFFAGILALLTAAVGVIGAFLIMAVLGVICGGAALGTIGWCIWWCVDPKGAMESYREAERDRLARGR